MDVSKQGLLIPSAYSGSLKHLIDGLSMLACSDLDAPELRSLVAVLNTRAHHCCMLNTVAGSTLLAALVHGGGRYLSVANVGDSRAVICDKNGRAHNLTVEHKPNDVRTSEQLWLRRKLSSRLEDVGSLMG